jgi:hypothetical protein
VRAEKKDRLATVSLKSISKFNQAARVAWWPTLGPANINLAARLLSKSARAVIAGLCHAFNRTASAD